MRTKASGFREIVEFKDVVVGSVINGVADSLMSTEQGALPVFNEKTGYARRKENDTVARLVISRHDEWIDVTEEIMNGGDIDTGFGDLSVEELKAIRQKEWEFPMGRKPSLTVEFGEFEAVCVIELPKARSQN